MPEKVCYHDFEVLTFRLERMKWSKAQNHHAMEWKHGEANAKGRRKEEGKRKRKIAEG